MTPDALTQARVQEAIRIVGEQGDLNHYGAEVALAMARLISEDWRPVDPLLVEAELIAVVPHNWHDPAKKIILDAVLAALKRGIEIGRQSVGEEG